MANLSRTTDEQYKELYNYAIGHQGAMEPGSTSFYAFLARRNLRKFDRHG